MGTLTGWTTCPISTRRVWSHQASWTRRRHLHLSLTIPSVSAEAMINECLDLYMRYTFPSAPLVHEPSLRSDAALIFSSTAPPRFTETDEHLCVASKRSFALLTALCATVASMMPELILSYGHLVTRAFYDAPRKMLLVYHDYDLENVDLFFTDKRGNSIGPETQCSWPRPNPVGFRDLLVWISRRHDSPKIYAAENGTSVKNENDLPAEQILQGDFRVKYYHDYVHAMAEASADNGVDVRGYFAQSLFDSFE